MELNPNDAPTQDTAALTTQLIADEAGYSQTQSDIQETSEEIQDLSEEISNTNDMHQKSIDAIKLLGKIIEQCTNLGSLYSWAMQITGDTTLCMSGSQNDGTNISTYVTSVQGESAYVTSEPGVSSTGTETPIEVNSDALTNDPTVTGYMVESNYYDELALQSQDFLVKGGAVDQSSLDSLETSIESYQQALGYTGDAGTMDENACAAAGSVYASAVVFSNYDPSSTPVACTPAPGGEMSGTTGSTILNEANQGISTGLSTVSGISSMMQTMVDYWANEQSAAIGAASYASDQVAQGNTTIVNNQRTN